VNLRFLVGERLSALAEALVLVRAQGVEVGRGQRDLPRGEECARGRLDRVRVSERTEAATRRAAEKAPAAWWATRTAVSAAVRLMHRQPRTEPLLSRAGRWPRTWSRNSAKTSRIVWSLLPPMTRSRYTWLPGSEAQPLCLSASTAARLAVQSRLNARPSRPIAVQRGPRTCACTGRESWRRPAGPDEGRGVRAEGWMGASGRKQRPGKHRLHGGRLER
jgi:hypothetical protein